MTITNVSNQLSNLGVPKLWQLLLMLHGFYAFSILFMGNGTLFHASNILIGSLVPIGIFIAIKHRKHKYNPWVFFLIGTFLVTLSGSLFSLNHFGIITNSLTYLGVEQVGMAFYGIYAFSFILQIEKEQGIKGFSINYSLIAFSSVFLVLLISPNLLNIFINEISFTQKIVIVNLFFSLFLLPMTLIGHTLSKTIRLPDIIRTIMVLLFIVVSIVVALIEFKYISGSIVSLAPWSARHLTGTAAILFTFLSIHKLSYKQTTSNYVGNQFMWIAGIFAVMAIPLGMIIRDRLNLPPINTMLVATTSFIVSSIIIWHFQNLINSINAHQKQLQKIAYTDPLTGLYNYHGYLDQLGRKNIDNLFVMSLNIEDFKSINDLHGREFGDSVLISLAKRLKHTPGTILVARTGSDYFQAVFRTTKVNIPSLVEKIRDHLGIWDSVNNRRIAVPLTYGASYSLGTIRPEVLARQAEQALKISRNAHTDFTLYSKDSTGHSNHSKNLPRHELREILQKAVDDNHLPIHFQPIYDLQSGALKALELLIRVESKEHGLLLPGQFLDQAKAYGLLTSLTQVCINMVAKCYGQLPDVTININVPPYMLDNPQVLKEFIDSFKKANLPISNFCIEVTEDGDIPTDHLIPAIKLLKSHGFKIAMDDFGTGYSSLSRLSVLPVDVVKIDRSLLLAASDGNRSILESAISLTKRLGASTVVEGVETLEQLSLIRQLGADSVQGFLLSKPVKISKVSLLSLNAVDIIPEFQLLDNYSLKQLRKANTKPTPPIFRDFALER